MVVQFVQAKATTLAVGISAGETSEIVLKRLVDIYGNALALSDFGTIIYLTINPGGDDEEIISATGFTVNSDGTVSLNAGIVRGLAAKSTYGSGGTASAHANGTPVIVSNNPQLYASLVNLTDAQTIAGVKTFSSLPATSAGNPISDNDLARKAYVDNAIAGISTTVNVVVAGTAGETVAAGDLVYFDDTDNEWKLCDADTAATVENTMLGIAQGAGVDGGAIASGVLLRGLDANQSGLTAGAIYYASNTAGEISASAGTKEVTVGFAYSTTQLYFNPRFNQQLTEDEQDALAGTEGTPSASNKFQTASGAQKGTPVYGASAAGTDAYAITPTPAVAAYSAGMKFRFLADVANTGAATLAVGSGAAKAIKKAHDQDLATGDIEIGQIVEVAYDAAADVWQMLSQTAQTLPLQADIQTFTATGAGTWTKPSGSPKRVLVQVWGGGGGGAKYASNNAAGGGGGGYVEKWFNASDLGSTEAITVGAGGAARMTDDAGNSGANSTFGTSGTLVTAYGGAGGDIQSAGNAATGGNGGGSAAVGSPTTPVTGIGVSGDVPLAAVLGGGGGGVSAGNVGKNGGFGEKGGGGGGGAGASGAGSGGSSLLGGAGGAGSLTTGTAGTQPGGGGGASRSGNSGAGGDGKVVVTTFF